MIFLTQEVLVYEKTLSRVANHASDETNFDSTNCAYWAPWKTARKNV